MGPSVAIEAAKCDRSLVGKAPGRRRVRVDPQLLFWRRMIDGAVHDAKRTHAGMPTALAISSRLWIEEFRPSQSDRDQWETSFACACSWLSLNVEEERKRCLEAIEVALMESYRTHVRQAAYQLRAAVLTCAGIATTIGRCYVLPLVAETDYETVAGVDHPDPAAVTAKLATLSAVA